MCRCSPRLVVAELGSHHRFLSVLSCPQYDQVTISQACWEQKHLKMHLARSTVEVSGRAHTQPLWHFLPRDRAEKRGSGAAGGGPKGNSPPQGYVANLSSRSLCCSELGSVCMCLPHCPVLDGIKTAQLRAIGPILLKISGESPLAQLAGPLFLEQEGLCCCHREDLSRGSVQQETPGKAHVGVSVSHTSC